MICLIIKANEFDLKKIQEEQGLNQIVIQMSSDQPQCYDLRNMNKFSEFILVFKSNHKIRTMNISLLINSYM